MNALQLVMSGILIPSCALAADAVQLSPWAQEPTSFMGVDLQGDFLKDVEECPAATVTTQTLCRISTDTPDQYLIQGASSRRVLLGYQLIAQLSNGKIEKLVFSGPSNSSALVAEMLRTDYGHRHTAKPIWSKPVRAPCSITKCFCGKVRNCPSNRSATTTT